MNKYLLPLGMLFSLIACQNKKANHPDLPGSWEAEYSVRADGDTTFYMAGSVSPCAYILLEGDYNSGFELTDDGKGELIWCGRNKEQFFTWSYDKNVMTVHFGDLISTYSITDLRESSMDITTGKGEKYHMKKYGSP